MNGGGTRCAASEAVALACMDGDLEFREKEASEKEALTVHSIERQSR